MKIGSDFVPDNNPVLSESYDFSFKCIMFGIIASDLSISSLFSEYLLAWCIEVSIEQFASDLFAIIEMKNTYIFVPSRVYEHHKEYFGTECLEHNVVRKIFVEPSGAQNVSKTM